MMQFASSLDPNEDGSYNPLRYFADVFNFIFNGLFVLELGIRSASWRVLFALSFHKIIHVSLSRMPLMQ
jgi:hypothetical protein